MVIIEIIGKTREKNKQYIIVKNNDKFGIGMIAYFKNSLNGQNVKKLTIKNSQDVTLFYNRIKGVYILQILKFSIDKQCIIDNYNNFKEKYDILTKDKISHL